ncbi:hypothetical protein R4Z10_18330 [Niallia sp. XMNu-256]|uniref:hypothetical protein n=1 Tax=Niallia sp. XMNu-256 TaxID=3082444 RepID=UPI0030CBAED9
MSALKNKVRYELLADQFKVRGNMRIPQGLEPSFERLFTYIYEETDLYYLDSIDEHILIGYIKYHSKNHFQTVSFFQCVKDIKVFLYFLEHIKGIESLPTIDLSLKNLTLWGNF